MEVELGQVRLKEELKGYHLLQTSMKVIVFKMVVDKDIKEHSQSSQQDQFMMMLLGFQIQEDVFQLGKIDNKKENKQNQ